MKFFKYFIKGAVCLKRCQSLVEFRGKLAALLEADGVFLLHKGIIQYLKIGVELHKSLCRLAVDYYGVYLALLERHYRFVAGFIAHHGGGVFNLFVALFLVFVGVAIGSKGVAGGAQLNAYLLP